MSGADGNLRTVLTVSTVRLSNRATQINEVTEQQTNRIPRIDFWRGPSTREYPHTQLYFRNGGALVIQSVRGGAFLKLGVAQSEIPPTRRCNEENETRK